MEYLQQFHKRVFRMHASYAGEADLQECDRRILSGAYSFWQLGLALQEMRDAQVLGGAVHHRFAQAS